MKKYFVFLLFVFSSCYLAGVSVCLAEEEVEYKTAQEYLSAALEVSYNETIGPEYLTRWKEKSNLLKRAIELSPQFTDSYVPYVKTYFERPGIGDYDNSSELDELIELLNKGLQYNPDNGDEFYLYLADLEYKRWGDGQIESHQRSLDYLEQALSKYQNSRHKSDLLVKKQWFLYLVGQHENRFQTLKQIVDLGEVNENAAYALNELFCHYSSVEDYKTTLIYTNKFLDRFGSQHTYGCLALCYQTEASFYTKDYTTVIKTGEDYLRICAPTKPDDPTIEIISRFVKRAYRETEKPQTKVLQSR